MTIPVTATIGHHRALLVLGLFGLSATFVESAYAMPSFARQTGQDCASCHVGGYGPQLTPYGIKFKMGGYTDSDGKSGHIPLSAMALGSFTHTSKDMTNSNGKEVNDKFSVDQVSGFVAGALSDHIGTFSQLTWDGVAKTTVLDNVDVRYSNTAEIGGKDTQWGISLNNNPTAQDPFNTLGAWRFPYVASALDGAPGPSDSPMIENLGQGVAGMTAYGYWDNSLFVEIGGYKSLQPNQLDAINADDPGRIVGVAPYWRLAWFRDERKWAYHIGLFGMYGKIDTNRVGGPTDQYTDLGIDGSYQFLGDRKDIFTFNGSYTHESTDPNQTASGTQDHLNKFDLSASWYHDQTYGLTADLFSVSDTSHSGVYAGDSNGVTFQADWTPWGKEDSWKAPNANLRLGAQYTIYNKLDGVSKNASDNNTLFLFAWTAF